MNSKVRILLDVDGVLNAVVGRDDRPADWGDWNTQICNGFPITYSRDMGDRIFFLARQPGVELLWLTTWEDEANTWIGPLFGWPRFELAGEQDYSDRSSIWWKYPIATKLWFEDKIPFVWIDDDLGGWDDGAAAWVDTLGDNALAVSPDTYTALTEAHLDEIENFVFDKL